MTQKTFVILIFFLATVTILKGQDRGEFIVGNIKFQGIEKTKRSFLEESLEVKKGDIVDRSDVESDVQRLKNILSIGNAQYGLDTLNGSVIITYKLEEVRTLLPILNLGGIKDNFWFQVGFTDNNWRGKGQLLAASYFNNDGLHGGQVYLRVPRFNSTRWGYSASLSNWTSREPLFFEEGTVNYIYENNSFALSAIRNFGINRSLELGGSFFVENYNKSEIQFLENPPGPEGLTETKFLSKVEYSENHLNYHFFYRSGYKWNITYQNVFNTGDKSLFNSVQFEGTKFLRPSKKINLAFRLKLAVSTNNDSPFAPFVADSHVNLRGVGNRIDRGTAQTVLNVEYRHTMFHKRNWSSQFVVFSDMGSWRNPGGKLSDVLDSDQFRQFIGGGVRLAYEKVFGAVIRIDYGVDIFNPSQKGLVIGLGQYF